MTPGRLTPRSGIHGFADYRLYVAAVLCLTAGTLFFESGGDLDAPRITLPFLVSFLVVSTVAWKHRLVGSAECLACVLLHILSLAALTLGFGAAFTAGLDGAVPTGPAADYAGLPGWSVRPALWVAETAGRAASSVFAPGVFSRIATVLATLLTMAGVIVGRRRAGIFFAAACLTAVLSFFRYGTGWEVLCFAGGAAALVGAFLLQREDAAKRDLWLLALRRTDETRVPRVHAMLELDILRELFGGGMPDRENLRQMAARRLRCEASDRRLDGVCEALLSRLIERRRLMTLRRDAGGERLLLDRRAFAGRLVPSGALAGAQSLSLVVLGLGYLLSPADFLADAVPVSGLLDDAVTLILCGLALRAVWRRR